MDNDNSDLAISIINKLAKDHDLNITIITARPSAKNTGKNDNQQDTGSGSGAFDL